MAYFLIPDAVQIWPISRKCNSCATDGRTDGPTDRRTDIPSYRDARTHLKTNPFRSQAQPILPLLPRSILGHYDFHRDPTEDAVFHDQLDHSLRLHRRPHLQRLLSAGRLRRESHALYLRPTVTHRLLPLALRHYSTHLTRNATHG